MRQWISAWGYQPMNYMNFPIQVEDETICVQFLNNVRGNKIRVLLSNRYGSEPLILEKIQLLIMNARASWEKSVQVDVLLNGQSQIMVPSHTELFSDEILVEITPGQYFAFLIQIKEKQEIYTGCSCFPQDYQRVLSGKGLLDAEQFADIESCQVRTELLKLEEEHLTFFGVVRVDVETEEDVKTIACFGDSITHRSLWTGPLALKLYQTYPGKVSLINCGISGNRIVHDESPYSEFGPWFGKAAVGRFERDVFGANRVDLVTVLLGINDIFHPLVGHAPKEETVTALQLESGLQKIIEMTHERKAKIIGCTITAWKNCMGLFNDASEETRTEVNTWIRDSGNYDAVFDFDAMIADPADPQQMLQLYDSGDHVHPSAKGGLRIAECIDLNQIVVLLGLEGA